MTDEKYLGQLGNKIWAFRKRRGLSRNKLARMCDMDGSNLALIEKGVRDCRLLTLKAIADALNCDVKTLL